jgi:hypothetical protein
MNARKYLKTPRLGAIQNVEVKPTRGKVEQMECRNVDKSEISVCDTHAVKISTSLNLILGLGHGCNAHGACRRSRMSESVADQLHRLKFRSAGSPKISPPAAAGWRAGGRILATTYEIGLSRLAAERCHQNSL